MRKITIIHPSRGRADLAMKTAALFVNSSETPLNYVFSIDEDDPEQQKYINAMAFLPQSKYGVTYQILVNKNKTAIEAINTAARSIVFDILVVLSDDFICHSAWDSQIIKSVAYDTNFVLKTNDGSGTWLVTLPILDYSYYKCVGYVYYPKYQHLFADTDMTHLATIAGRLIVDNDILIVHVWKNATGGGDHINEKNDKTWNQGEQLYLSRVKENFDLKPHEIRGKITDINHLDWLSLRIK